MQQKATRTNEGTSKKERRAERKAGNGDTKSDNHEQGGINDVTRMTGQKPEIEECNRKREQATAKAKFLLVGKTLTPLLFTP